MPLLALVTGIALAITPELPWSEVSLAADTAFARGAGAVLDAAAEGAEDARRAEPPSAIRLELTSAPSTVWQGLDRYDDNTAASLSFTVGDRRGARRARWRARAELLAADHDAERLAYADAVRLAWLDAWVAISFAEHLHEHADQLETDLDALRAGVTRGTVRRTLVDELDVERGRLRAEAAQHELAADVARIELAGLLGRVVDVDVHSLPSLEDTVAPTTNPWRGVLEHLDALPSLRRLDADAAHLDADARAARSDSPVTVTVGGIYRPTPTGEVGASPLVGVAVPLTRPTAPEAREASARAQATRERVQFERERLHAELTAEADALDRAVLRHQTMIATLEAPLAERVERLQADLGGGATTVDALVRARRDLHEAFHDRARTTADLMVRVARGEALLTLLRAPQESR